MRSSLKSSNLCLHDYYVGEMELHFRHFDRNDFRSARRHLNTFEGIAETKNLFRHK